MNAETETSANVVRQCVEKLNQSKTEWIDIFYSKDAEWIEHPTIAYPNGRRGNVEELRRARETSLAFFPDRQMKIVNQITEGKQSTVELDWWGTTARKMGNVEAGTIVRLRIASYFVVENNKIIKHIDYVVPNRQ
jgi:predicted SnoaL-like aldol condensation-catalyzing enzyme